MPDEPPIELPVGSRTVKVTHPSKIVFDEARLTKLDLVKYYLSIADGAIRGVRDRPFVLKRFVEGAKGPPFYQKRAPTGRPDWLRTVVLSFPSGRTAEEVVLDDPAGLAWVVNLGCIELHPHLVRATDLDHPDELRVDLDPCPGVEWADVRRVAEVVKETLEDHGLVGFPKTSGSRGLHVLVRIEPRWGFDDVRRAALAFAREVERRAPAIATSKWWKEERHGVFLDYNQNAKDRTTCSAYSVRPLADARVSAPLGWDEVPACEPADFTVATMPARFAERGDLHEGIDGAAYSLERLLALADRQSAEGMPDAPWPPHYEKKEGEAPRVAPSRKKKDAPKTEGSKTGTGRRVSKMPLVVVAVAKVEADAIAGLERWKARHAGIAELLAADDVLVDKMRGRSSPWTRVRINLRHVPEEQRPPPEEPDPNEDMSLEWKGWKGPPKG